MEPYHTLHILHDIENNIPNFMNLYIGHCSAKQEFAHLVNLTKWFHLELKWMHFWIHPKSTYGSDSRNDPPTVFPMWHLGDSSSEYMLHCSQSLQHYRLIKVPPGREMNWIPRDLDMFVAWLMLILCLGTTVHLLCVVFIKSKSLFKNFDASVQMVRGLCCKIFKGLLCVRSLWSDDDSRLRKLSNRRRLEQALFALRILAPVVWLLSIPINRKLAGYIMGVMLDGPHQGPHGGNVRRIHFLIRETEIVPLNVIASLYAVFTWVPRCTKPRGLDIANAILAAVWIWKTSLLGKSYSKDASYFHYHNAWIISLRTAQGLILGNATLTSILHVIWTMFDIYIFSGLHNYVSKDSPADEFFAYRQMALGVGAVALSWVFELTRWAEVKAVVEAEQRTGAYIQLSRVLSALCDAVITLDSSLRIIGGPDSGVGRLRSLLMLQTGDMMNKSFTEYVSSSDLERFTSYMQQEAVSLKSGTSLTTQAQSIHLSLKDRYGLRVAVQLFCSSLLDHNEKPMHVLGIRQDLDAEAAGLALLSQQEAAASSVATPTVIGREAVDGMNFAQSPRTRRSRSHRSRGSSSRSRASIDQNSSTSSGSIGRAEAENLDQNPVTSRQQPAAASSGGSSTSSRQNAEDVSRQQQIKLHNCKCYAWFDVMHEELQIIKSSTDCQKFLGLKDGMNLSNWLIDPVSFQHTVLSHLYAAMENTSEISLMTANLGSITMQPPPLTVQSYLAAWQSSDSGTSAACCVVFPEFGDRSTTLTSL